MAVRRKISLEAVLASLKLVCPKCQGEIHPSLMLQINIKCPPCDSIVKLHRKVVPEANA